MPRKLRISLVDSNEASLASADSGSYVICDRKSIDLPDLSILSQSHL
ncbi:hypothetical protein [Scytonema sp. NUACC26]